MKEDTHTSVRGPVLYVMIAIVQHVVIVSHFMCTPGKAHRQLSRVFLENVYAMGRVH